MEKELKTRQVCLFVLAILPVTKFFMLPSILSNAAKEDMWISALICLLLDLITVTLLTLFFKSEDRNFFQILEDAFGKSVKNAILVFYLIFFMTKAFLPITEQRDYVELTLYMTMPSHIYFLPFFISAFYICSKKLRLLGRISDILFLMTLAGYMILFLLSVSNTDWGAILPIGARGIKSVVSGSQKGLNWFSDGAYFLFFIGNYKNKKKDSLKIILTFVLYLIMIVLFMIIFNGVFTSIGFRQKFALTETSKYTTVISNMGRFDYIGITLILFSNVFALAVPLFFATKILEEIFSIKKEWIAPLITCGITLIITVFFDQYYYSIEKFLTCAFSYYFLIFGSIIPVLTPLLKRRKNENA